VHRENSAWLDRPSTEPNQHRLVNPARHVASLPQRSPRFVALEFILRKRQAIMVNASLQAVFCICAFRHAAATQR
jgi:hypothetical protein